MGIELCMDSKEISEDKLVDIFKLFCDAYDLGFMDADERFLRSEGIEKFRKGHLDYNPCPEAKFIGNVYDTKLHFHGYANFGAADERIKSENFKNLVIEYFKKP